MPSETARVHALRDSKSECPERQQEGMPSETARVHAHVSDTPTKRKINGGATHKVDISAPQAPALPKE